LFAGDSNLKELMRPGKSIPFGELANYTIAVSRVGFIEFVWGHPLTFPPLILILLDTLGIATTRNYNLG
jgi:hypothetical protein